MKPLEVVAIAIILHLSLIHSYTPTWGEWSRLTTDGRETVSEKVFLIFTPNRDLAVYLPLKDLSYLHTHPLFNKSRPTMIYFHGWLESGKMDLSCIGIRGAYNDRGDHNVISVDWSYYAKDMFYHINVIPQMIVIAEEFAERLQEVLNTGYSIDNLHLVGHSLGGQMVGKVGRQLKKISNGTLVIPRIYALDPAGPGFEDHNINGMEPISRTDGKAVQIIHTCGGKLGMLHRVGTIDFYPDGGTKHPGCDVDITASMVEPYQYVCDHARSWHLYQLSVRDPQALPAVRCNDYDDFLSGGCFKEDVAFMGFGANMSETGKYFLQTNANLFNLTRGSDGIKATNYTLVHLQVPSGDEELPIIPPKVQEMIFF